MLEGLFEGVLRRLIWDNQFQPVFLLFHKAYLWKILGVAESKKNIDFLILLYSSMNTNLSLFPLKTDQNVPERGQIQCHSFLFRILYPITASQCNMNWYDNFEIICQNLRFLRSRLTKVTRIMKKIWFFHSTNSKIKIVNGSFIRNLNRPSCRTNLCILFVRTP